MSNTAKAIIAVVILAVLAGGAWLAAGRKGTNPSGNPVTPPTSQNTAPSQSSSQANTAKPAVATITYTGSAFQLTQTTVKAGDTVKVTNQSNQTLDFNSDPHPVHTDEPELNVGDVSSGESKTFTVTKTGAWGYHNHDNPSQRGTLIVQ